MTPVEAKLLGLGAVMLALSGYTYYKTRSAWLVAGVVALSVAAAYWAGLIA